jgi:adenosyl cobinamide kinase/adenosyl cobinamide phosphate guanylyltransferase
VEEGGIVDLPDHGPDASRTPALPSLTLVLGGARSGKSRHAESLVEAAGGGTYIATAEAGDDEMRARIAEHRARRGPAWRTIEEPRDLAAALTRAASHRQPVLVDCLTLWLSNLLLADLDIEAASDALVASLAHLGVPVVMVANEVGLGIVPDNALARRFRDEAGRLNQRLAACADRVLFLAAGLPLALK